MDKPMLYEVLGCGVCSLVLGRHSHCKPSEHVSQDEHVLVPPIGPLKHGVVHCHYFKGCHNVGACHRGFNFGKYVFCQSAPFAFLNPSLYIFGHCWPVIAPPHEVKGALFREVTTMFMLTFKHSTLQTPWDD